MKRLLCLLLLLFTPNSEARAEDLLPDGCYVSYSNPNYCWVAPSGVTVWAQNLSENELGTKYGITVGTIILSGASRERERNQYQALYNQCLGASNEWQSYGKTQAALVAKNNALIKKLRKACGTKCKKIK